jgi:hypothetical protein
MHMAIPHSITCVVGLWSTCVDCQQPTTTAAAAAAAAVGLCDEAILDPSVAHPNETPRYKTARVGSVHPVVRRKWSWREGSVTAEEKAAEEAERAAYPSQESLIAGLYKLA